MTGVAEAIRAKVAGFTDDGCTCFGWVLTGYPGSRDALLAVLDLHKPNPGADGRAPYCDVCAGGYEGVSEWPCGTVRAIAEKLGVEVYRVA